MILPTSKANYPKSTLPAFDFPPLTPCAIEAYKDQQFVVHMLPNGGLPVVIAINPDRLHVYNETTEFKYNAFSQDVYAKAIGEHEVALRSILPGNALFGWIYPDDNIIRLFHIWSVVKSEWLDTRQIETLRRNESYFTQKVRLPQVEAIDTLENLVKSYRFNPPKEFNHMWIFVKSVNDPGVFFVKRDTSE